MTGTNPNEVTFILGIAFAVHDRSPRNVLSNPYDSPLFRWLADAGNESGGSAGPSLSVVRIIAFDSDIPEGIAAQLG